MFSDFNFPPSRLDGQSNEQIRATDEEERQREWEANLGIEQADPTTDDSRSGSSPSATFLNLTGPVRQPPQEFLERLKLINEQTDFGVSLCGVSSVLEEVVKDQGPNRVMVSVIPFVTSNPSFIDQLPLICVCQLYLLVVSQQNGLPVEDLMHSADFWTKAALNNDVQAAVSIYLHLI